ncbi:hypothetical protein F383_11474 [Gossypium arboreum]|uniref:Uncharacterized protein n=1 Tax=Gossypium arboreum TaxID=29729 RepID=A0A0B0MEK4_GOSAR|nr:hypothetical protein F383_11474 [Gossypium arboreum]
MDMEKSWVERIRDFKLGEFEVDWGKLNMQIRPNATCGLLGILVSFIWGFCVINLVSLFSPPFFIPLPLPNLSIYFLSCGRSNTVAPLFLCSILLSTFTHLSLPLFWCWPNIDWGDTSRGVEKCASISQRSESSLDSQSKAVEVATSALVDLGHDGPQWAEWARGFTCVNLTVGLGYCYGGRNRIGGYATCSDISIFATIVVSAATGANTIISEVIMNTRRGARGRDRGRGGARARSLASAHMQNVEAKEAPALPMTETGLFDRVVEDDALSQVIVEVVKGRKSRNLKRVVIDMEESWVERIRDFKLGEFKVDWGKLSMQIRVGSLGSAWTLNATCGLLAFAHLSLLLFWCCPNIGWGNTSRGVEKGVDISNKNRLLYSVHQGVLYQTFFNGSASKPYWQIYSSERLENSRILRTFLGRNCIGGYATCSDISSFAMILVSAAAGANTYRQASSGIEGCLRLDHTINWTFGYN